MYNGQEQTARQSSGRRAERNGMERLLSRIEKLRHEIAQDEIRLGIYRDRAQSATGRATALRYSGLRSSKLEYNALCAIDLERETAEKRVKLRLLRQKLTPWLKVIRGQEARRAVYLRYVGGYSVERVARARRFTQDHAEFLISRGRDELVNKWREKAAAKASAP